jgi:glycerate kinase
VAKVPGAGAAGGIGAGLIAFLDAELRSGAELVAEVVGLEKRIAAADLVVTGEGRLDAQTAYGKTVATVARLARGQGRPVVALAGRVDDAQAACSVLGLEAALSIVPSAMGGLPEAEVDGEASSCSAAAEALGRLVKVGGTLQANASPRLRLGGCRPGPAAVPPVPAPTALMAGAGFRAACQRKTNSARKMIATTRGRRLSLASNSVTAVIPACET